VIAATATALEDVRHRPAACQFKRPAGATKTPIAVGTHTPNANVNTGFDSRK
jgi:hypothetical protein